jgi:PIN domain nuclease of toxin-antitoxin system
VARYLIDSHIFLWAIDAPEKLLASERALLEDDANGIAVSVASFWELSIKAAIGKLPIRRGQPAAGGDYLLRQAVAAGFDVLPIEAAEAEYVRQLPHIHRDPFDLLLIAQALLGGRVIVTRDTVFARYPGVRVFDSGRI